VEGFALGQIANEAEGGSDVLSRQIVFALNLLESHAPSQAADHQRHWHARAPNDGFSVAHRRVNYDTVMLFHKHIVSNAGALSKSVLTR